MQQFANTRPWQLCFAAESAPADDTAALATAPAPEEAADEDFQNRLLKLKNELHGGAPTSLEEMLRDPSASAGDGELRGEELRKENERLRQNLEQARQRVLQFEKDAEQWRAREKEYELMLEEKSELIRQLHQEARAQQAAPRPDGPSEDELVALHQELQRERQMLEEDRAALEEQFRLSELQMSKERADIAKLKSEANRMQNEVKRQMEILEREAKVRGEMGNFLKLREELQASANRTPGGRQTPVPGSNPQNAMPDLPSLDRRAPASGPQSRKSFFGGLFQRGEE